MIEPTVTPAQYEACVELVDRSTGLNCVSDTHVIVELLVGLVQGGFEALVIIKWLNLLPRVKEPATLPSAPSVAAPSPGQLALTTESALTPAMRAALAPREGESKRRSVDALTDPAAADRRVITRGRAATGVCSVCEDEFAMNPWGRPATKCEKHRNRGRGPKSQEPAA